MPGDRVVDLLLTPAGESAFEGERIDSRHTHGTGCTLASACATGLAQASELTWQLRGTADKRQVPGAALKSGVALQHNIGLGGAVVVTAYRPADR